GKIVWSVPEQFSVWSGALATAGGVVFYGTLEGYLKAVDAKTGKELYKFKTPSGIIGNVTTYEHAVHCDSVRRRRLGRHWSCRRADGSHRRPGRRWRLCCLEELHIARRPAHGVAGILWGPMAGYYARQATPSELHARPAWACRASVRRPRGRWRAQPDSARRPRCAQRCFRRLSSTYRRGT